MPSLGTDYLIHLRRRGLAVGTIERRRIALEAFTRWLDPRSLADATAADLELFLDHREPMESRTRYCWISHLNCVYVWAVANGHATSNPTERVVRPKLRPLLPRPISESDLQVAVEHASAMHVAWLMLAGYAGLRCCEIAALDVGDVVIADSALWVRGKGGKERVVPMHPRVMLALRSYGLRRSGPLFRRPQGGRYTPKTVSREGNKFLRSLSIDATMHQLRHRFGTKALEASGDLRAVQELLGHSSPQTTAIYTKVTSRRLRNVVEMIDASASTSEVGDQCLTDKNL